MKKQAKQKYVKVEALESLPDEDIEWYAVGQSRGEAKSLADEMGMPTDNRKYTDLYLTQEQYEAIPEWQG
jgi:hypothetical protein